MLLKKVLYEVKKVVSSLFSTYFNSPQLGVEQKQTVQNLGKYILRYAQFWFFLHCILWIVFQEKCFSCYILLTDLISFTLLSLLLEIFANTCIVIVCFSGCDISFVLSFVLIKPFFNMTKTSRQKFKYLQNNKKNKNKNKKHFSSILKGFQFPRNCIRIESTCLKFFTYC